MTKKDFTIEFAPTDQVDDLEPWVLIVLNAIGVEALITNESWVGDFRTFGQTPMERDLWLVELQAKLGLEFTLGTRIVDLAKMVRDARTH